MSESSVADARGGPVTEKYDNCQSVMGQENQDEQGTPQEPQREGEGSTRSDDQANEGAKVDNADPFQPFIFDYGEVTDEELSSVFQELLAHVVRPSFPLSGGVEDGVTRTGTPTAMLDIPSSPSSVSLPPSSTEPDSSPSSALSIASQGQEPREDVQPHEQKAGGGDLGDGGGGVSDSGGGIGGALKTNEDEMKKNNRKSTAIRKRFRRSQAPSQAPTEAGTVHTLRTAMRYSRVSAADLDRFSISQLDAHITALRSSLRIMNTILQENSSLECEVLCSLFQALCRVPSRFEEAITVSSNMLRCIAVSRGEDDSAYIDTLRGVVEWCDQSIGNGRAINHSNHTTVALYTKYHECCARASQAGGDLEEALAQWRQAAEYSAIHPGARSLQHIGDLVAVARLVEEVETDTGPEAACTILMNVLSLLKEMPLLMTSKIRDIHSILRDVYVRRELYGTAVQHAFLVVRLLVMEGQTTFLSSSTDGNTRRGSSSSSSSSSSSENASSPPSRLPHLPSSLPRPTASSSATLTRMSLPDLPIDHCSPPSSPSSPTSFSQSPTHSFFASPSLLPRDHHDLIATTANSSRKSSSSSKGSRDSRSSSRGSNTSDGGGRELRSSSGRDSRSGSAGTGGSDGIARPESDEADRTRSAYFFRDKPQASGGGDDNDDDYDAGMQRTTTPITHERLLQLRHGMMLSEAFWSLASVFHEASLATAKGKEVSKTPRLHLADAVRFYIACLKCRLAIGERMNGEAAKLILSQIYRIVGSERLIAHQDIGRLVVGALERVPSAEEYLSTKCHQVFFVRLVFPKTVALQLLESEKPGAVPRCSGHLSKKGKIIENWKRRWFLLEKETMGYYRPECDAVENLTVDKALGTISIHDVTKVFVLDKSKDGRDHVFQIETPRRIFYAQAADREDADRWVSVIEDARTFWEFWSKRPRRNSAR